MYRQLMKKDYSESDVVREFNRSGSVESVAKKFGISSREVNRAIAKAGVTERYKRTRNEQDSFDAGLSKDDFIEE
ncbi:MAG: hypothetical protein LUH21_04355 [Clostridiales bacterium]|nr:hypothetical protein [Clostridiales bacterium]